MSMSLVTARTADGIELDGLLYQPAGSAPRKRAAVFVIHGLTWNFYRGPSRWLPPLLTDAGYACLSLNMRDHDLSESKDFELSYHDLRAGIEFLLDRENAEVILLAHGYACNKVICYPAFSGDQRIERQILTTLGAVKSYRPDIWEAVLASAPKLRGETLIVQGAIDRLIEARERAEELKTAAGDSHVDTAMLEGANHYFDERHRELADTILGWIERTGRET